MSFDQKGLLMVSQTEEGLAAAENERQLVALMVFQESF